MGPGLVSACSRRELGWRGSAASTPAGDFRRVVPFLLVLAALALLLQPTLSTWQEKHLIGTPAYVLPCGLFGSLSTTATSERARA